MNDEELAVVDREAIEVRKKFCCVLEDVPHDCTSQKFWQTILNVITLLYSILYYTKCYMEFNFTIRGRTIIKTHKLDGSLLYITTTSRTKLGFLKSCQLIIQAI